MNDALMVGLGFGELGGKCWVRERIAVSQFAVGIYSVSWRSGLTSSAIGA